MLLRQRALSKQFFPPGPASVLALALRCCLPLPLFANHVHIRPVSTIHFTFEHRLNVPIMTIMDPRFIPAQETNLLPGWEIDARGIKRNGIGWMRTPHARLLWTLIIYATSGHIDTPIWHFEHIPVA